VGPDALMTADKTTALDPLAEARRQWDLRWEGGISMEAATSIMRAQQLVLAAVEEALAPYSLTFARYEALVLLFFTKTGALPLGKMGTRLMIHAASVTNIVDRLEAQALVQRVPHPTDGRGTLCAITPEGRSVVQAATKAVTAVDLGVGALNEQECRQLIRLVRKLRTANGDAMG
jgi:DNA-binding MarR family transcriptional regulator